MVKWWIIFGTVAVLIWFFRNAGRTTQPALPPRPQPPARKGGTGPLPPRVQEPQTIQTIEDLKALHLGARQALQDGKADEAMRLIGRLFTEAALGDVKVIVSVLGQSWVQDTKSAKAPIGAAVAVAVEAVGQDDFERAFEAVRVALAEAGAGGEPEPMNGVLLVAGLRVAVGVRASQANEDRFQALVEQASKLLVTPGGQEEAHRLFRQALALIPDPPQSDRDRARRARIAMFIDPPPPAESYDALLERGKALLDTDLPGALAAFEQATQVMPDDGAGWAGRAGVL
jgi:tetratricopeptide (TPR) repeat protein